MKVALLGATGVAGRQLLPRLLAGGHAVVAASRSAAADGALRAAGATPVRSDILDPPSLAGLLAGCDAAINLATAVPRPGSGGAWTTNDRIRREGTRALVAACRAQGVARLLQQSIAMLHGADDHTPQDESSPVAAPGVLASALEMERCISDSPLEWQLVRGGLLYGPGTGYPEAWLEALARPGFCIPGDGAAWVSPLHVADFADALALVLDRGAPHEAYIACEAPLTLGNLYAALARRTGRPAPAAGGSPGPPFPFRTSSAKLRRLGWRPAHHCASQEPLP